MIRFGPRDEKEITVGAALSTGSILFRMFALGVLYIKHNHQKIVNFSQKSVRLAMNLVDLRR